jgi:hypothetical protein
MYNSNRYSNPGKASAIYMKHKTAVKPSATSDAEDECMFVAR